MGLEARAAHYFELGRAFDLKAERLFQRMQDMQEGATEARIVAAALRDQAQRKHAMLRNVHASGLTSREAAEEAEAADDELTWQAVAAMELQARREDAEAEGPAAAEAERRRQAEAWPRPSMTPRRPRAREGDSEEDRRPRRAPFGGWLDTPKTPDHAK